MALSLQYLLALALGYLLGSIPFGLLLTRLAGLGDVRMIGSGNIGATNVLRTGRKDLAAATLALDALKATFAAVFAEVALGGGAGLVAAAGAFLGHLYPVWLGFKGGKGVATFLGGLIGVFLPGALAFAVTWLGIAYLTRYSSAAALAASLAAPLAALAMHQTLTAEVFLGLAALLWLRHLDNIRRLLGGQETKIGAKKAA